MLALHLAERTDSPWLIVAGLLLTGGMIIVAYLRQPEDETGDPRTTTIAALFLCYEREVLSWLEEFQYAVLSLVNLPLLPDRDHGTYGALNPYQIWWMVVLISGVSLAGYAALRLIGQRRGEVALGVLGGLVSSTATTFTFGRHARSGDPMTRISIIVTIAILSNFAFKSAVTFVLGGRGMARHAIAGMGAIAIGLIAAWAVLRVI